MTSIYRIALNVCMRERERERGGKKTPKEAVSKITNFTSLQYVINVKVRLRGKVLPRMGYEGPEGE
jgi:hypothetical protein